MRLTNEPPEWLWAFLGLIGAIGIVGILLLVHWLI